MKKLEKNAIYKNLFILESIDLFDKVLIYTRFKQLSYMMSVNSEHVVVNYVETKEYCGR